MKGLRGRIILLLILVLATIFVGWKTDKSEYFDVDINRKSVAASVKHNHVLEINEECESSKIKLVIKDILCDDSLCYLSFQYLDEDNNKIDVINADFDIEYGSGFNKFDSGIGFDNEMRQGIINISIDKEVEAIVLTTRNIKYRIDDQVISVDGEWVCKIPLSNYKIELEAIKIEDFNFIFNDSLIKVTDIIITPLLTKITLDTGNSKLFTHNYELELVDEDDTIYNNLGYSRNIDNKNIIYYKFESFYFKDIHKANLRIKPSMWIKSEVKLNESITEVQIIVK